MSLALPLDLLVDITSQSVGNPTFTIGKLPTLLITKYNSAVPNAQFTSFTTLNAVKKAFNVDSVQNFASNYFGFTSKNATKADLLAVYNWSTTDTPAAIKGATAPSVATLATLNGNVVFTIDGVSETIVLDFSGVSTLTAAATVIQTALNAKDGGFKNATCEFSSFTDGFIIKTGTTGANASISISAAADSDLSTSLGLSAGEGAEFISGYKATDFDGALTAIDEQNGNYYIITTDFEFDTLESDLITFGAWLKNSNGRFLGIYSDANILTLDTEFLDSYDGLLLDYKLADSQNGLVCAYFSSLNLSKANANVNIAFNDATLFSTKAITERAVFEKLEAKKLNAPCKFGILGQDDTRYMNGDIFGTLTQSANVYFANSYIKFQEQIALYNMMSSGKLIGIRDLQSLNTAQGYIAEVFENSVKARLIAVGATLTSDEKSAISQIFDGVVDSVEDVYNAVSQYGYFFKITDIDTKSKTLTITQIYMANAPVRKFVIANYILGA